MISAFDEVGCFGLTCTFLSGRTAELEGEDREDDSEGTSIVFAIFNSFSESNVKALLLFRIRSDNLNE